MKIFVDFEMNPIPRGIKVNRMICNNEIVQIGAVALDANNNVVGKFNQYVKPQYSKTIAPRIFRLTSITTKLINEGIDFEEAILDLAIWCETLSGEGEYEIYAWSDNDLIQLQKEMLIKDLTDFFDMEFMNVWTDFQFEFSELLGIDSVISLDKAIKSLDIDFEGRQHNALNDALNTSKLYQISQNTKEFERVMRPIREVMAAKKHLSTSLGSVFNRSDFSFAG